MASLSRLLVQFYQKGMHDPSQLSPVGHQHFNGEKLDAQAVTGARVFAQKSAVFQRSQQPEGSAFANAAQLRHLLRTEGFVFTEKVDDGQRFVNGLEDILLIFFFFHDRVTIRLEEGSRLSFENGAEKTTGFHRANGGGSPVSSETGIHNTVF